MNFESKRPFRPRIESLEQHTLLSGGLIHPAVVVHQMKVVDLKPTAVGTLLTQELTSATQGAPTSLDSLIASQKGRSSAKIQGQISIVDPLTSKGPVTVIIKFSSPLEHPKARSVQIQAGKFAKLLTKSQSTQLKAGLAAFVTQQHDQITSVLKSS